MKQFILTSLSALLFTVSAIGSTEVCIDHNRKTITLTAHYYFYGDEANDIVAKNCVDEINRQFNNGHKIQLNKSGDWLDVKVNVTHMVLKEWAAQSFSGNNYDPKYNFVRIDTPTKGSRVTVSEHGLNSNYGYFITKNGLGTSTTCTHEFAHGLGLVHVDPCDWRGKGVPPIMAARGCLVDKDFQYNPKAKAGKAGGTINPVTRQVLSKEFSLINMGDLHYRWVAPHKECASQGKSLRRLYRKDGSVYTATNPFNAWELQANLRSDTTQYEPMVIPQKLVKPSPEKQLELESIKQEVLGKVKEDMQAGSLEGLEEYQLTEEEAVTIEN